MYIKLKEVDRYSEFREIFKGKPTRIWTDEWSCWWRIDGKGYTKDATCAGVFSFEEAYRMSCGCGPEKQIVFKIEEIFFRDVKKMFEVMARAGFD